ncbi:MAG: hypothetical protein M3042_08895 [Actinomycetota bacterium]|nr:hypothetical protein [Actinomycetota bacterium]
MSARARALRQLALILGAGALGGVALPALVAGQPATSAGPAEFALGAPAPAAVGHITAAERTAIELLRRAAVAGRERTYSGTQFLTSWSGGGTFSIVVELQHMPDRGVLVRRSGAASPAVVDDTGAADLDPRALAVLERHYSVSVTRQAARCAGRTARVVEVHPRGTATVAGRFWLDVATGLILRRELYDGSGRTVRAAAFVDVTMAAPAPWTGPVQAADSDDGSVLAAPQLAALRRQGWHAPARLSGLELFDTRRRSDVLQLSYTDGLFALSVFSQRGRLDPASVKGWQPLRLGATQAWTRPGLSQRVVWAGSGWVYTAVADAPDPVVAGAVAGFPGQSRESFLHRVRRGLNRMGSWLNPVA